jgi:hypothetical protein
MLSQTEATRQIGDQTLPLNDMEVRKRPRKPWLVLTIVLIAVATVFLWGVWSRVKASTVLKAETAQMARPAVSVVSPKQTAPAEEIHRLANLCPHQWVSDEVVLRHWSPRQARTTACCDRNS